MFAKIASVLAIGTAVVHLVVGGADALAPTLAVELPAPAAGAMHACWHIVSAFLIWSAVVFWRGGVTSVHFASLWVISALVFMYVGIFQGGLQGLVTNPQWTILGTTGALSLVHYWREDKSL